MFRIKHGTVSSLLLTIFLVVVVASGFADRTEAGVTVAPGSTVSLAAEGCDGDTGGANDLGGCPNCLFGCDLPTNVADTFLLITPSNPLDIGLKWATSTVYSNLSVSSTPETRGNVVQATVSYDVFWKGGWTLAGLATGFNDAKTDITVEFVDLTDNTIVHTQHVHTQRPDGFIGIDIIDVGFGLDRGSQQSSFTAMLKRGNNYQLRLTTYAEAKSALNAVVELDYMTNEWGVGWSQMDVEVEADLRELIAGLQGQIDTLRTDLETHQHVYLTGKGVGHNNTEALTGMAVFFDDSSEDPDSTVLPDEAGLPIPTKSRLGQNFPNPFNPTTTVSFTIPEDSHVQIKIYNVLGQNVMTLVDGSRPAGEHNVTLDASNMASGVYYYRLVAGEFVETRKMVVVK